jgi:hypothetical protein
VDIYRSAKNTGIQWIRNAAIDAANGKKSKEWIKNAGLCSGKSALQI